MFSSDLIARAEALLVACRAQNLRIAAAESCTGGLLCGLLTEIPGSSNTVDRGFITYSDVAKIELLGVGAPVIARHGAVSAAVALAMAEGVLKHAPVDLAVAITGIAGPDGGSQQKPVGLVYIAVERRSRPANIQRFTFGAISRREIREHAVGEALTLLFEAVRDQPLQ
jgi:nicotinamide-nucleotide amidase